MLFYFTAYTPANGQEIWIYDGTETRLYTEANVGAGGSNPGPLMLANNNLVYVGTNGTTGLELFVVGTYNSWNGASGSTWSTGASWQNGIVPGATDNALLPYTGVMTEAALDVDATVVRLDVNNGRILTLNSTKTLTVTDNVFNNGIIQGTGTLATANFTNTGTVAPGVAAGILNITGNFINQGTVAVELGGTTAGTQYDRLAVTGAITAGGILDISLINGFSVANGQTFTIMTGSSVTGTFSTVNWPAGVSGTISYTATSVQINITSTLPLTLLSFTARLNADKVELNWKTADEINTSYFEVQRSNDGAGFNNVIANIPAAGNGNHNYTTIDASPASGSNYYRLKMTDRDGRFKYSNTLLIRIEENGGVRLSPVPAASNIDITVTDQSLIGKKARIFDNTGKQIMEITLKSNNSINISGWVTGVYFVKTENGKAIQFIKR